MMHLIDSLLNKVSMYKLVLYELIFLLVAAAVLGQFGLVPYSPLYLGYSVVVIFAVAWIVNKVFAFFYEAPTNPESTYITALILALIITPATAFGDTHFLALAGWAAATAIASKYIFAIKEKHIFNPAAFGVAATALFLNMGASWWIGTLWMLPFVAVGGCMVARKIHRLDMVIATGVSIVGTILVLSFGDGAGVFHIIQESLLYAPVVFLATVMLTEPLTTPPTRFLRIMYGILVGFFLAPEVHFGTFYFTPELALLAGNLFSYAVTSKTKLLLTLKDRIQLSPDTYEFIFNTNGRTMKFLPGQYLEWTLPHAKADGRGVRRYFTIASAPGDPDIRIGVKFYDPSSTFKKTMLALRKGSSIVANQLAGDFTLPTNKKKKLVFIAGGIGITPFRSMIEDLRMRKEHRDIKLIYSNRTIKDTAYVELLDRAQREIGIETIPVFSTQTPEMLATNEFPAVIDQHLIMSSIPDYEDRLFYLSGPRGMVVAFQDLLRGIGVPRSHIHTDFFPGFS